MNNTLAQTTCMSCGKPANIADDEHDDDYGLCVRCYDKANEQNAMMSVFRQAEAEVESEACIENVERRTEMLV